jgi:hypothetical protein
MEQRRRQAAMVERGGGAPKVSVESRSELDLDSWYYIRGICHQGYIIVLIMRGYNIHIGYGLWAGLNIHISCPLSYLWVGLNIHIGYGLADPHIIQTTIIITCFVHMPKQNM